MKGQTHVEMLTIVAIGLGYRGSIVGYIYKAHSIEDTFLSAVYLL